MEALIPFTTSGALVDCVDKKVLVVLRDGRKLIGVLRSYDQFANLVLEGTIERKHLAHYFSEQPVGVMIIRGENVVLLGEIDLDVEDEVPLQAVPLKELDVAYKREQEYKKRREAEKSRILFEAAGFSKEGGEGDGY
ncbi:SM-like, degradation of cytoplasmic mRNAs and positively regulates transcription initiation [Serendipita sp. 396]|nr:SM-like, degradation of cytoplasmic mRNAs and positively regulates transcription initiation [Serendipita sp. 396]KAG8789677.1 SM-like, degradation of cytoplasmic mRNAs and positively regulates transcription initiation [Serendipita sp. 397]KAG8825778.1 SM-like, degradation of cytoplasmic mRNAs and positively regulates transcription initiation [Serendipita sp. 401]KAG8837001.1 SM-like, degradation of cytoplasmic mRNAs and positively regulates transcription initiation [Serendipita sp. 400]KAG88